MPLKHVFLIGVDGAGAFFRNTDTPNLDAIFENGAVSYEVLTSNPTISAECWGSMLLGVTPEVHGLTNSIVSTDTYPTDGDFPSVFRVIRGAMPDAQLASFCNWNPINHGIIEENLGVVKDTGADELLTGKICAYLKENDPTFLFVQFDDVDGAGHHYGYGTEGHLAQIRTTDGYIKQIWDVCRERGFLEDGLFIVTADHGGFDHGHGGWTDGEKYVMFAAAGKTVARGTIGEMGIRDTASVILYALGLADRQPVSWTSRVPSGMFEGVEAGERPVGMAKPEIKPEVPFRLHEPVSAPDGKCVTDLFGAYRVLAYLPFDGDIAEATGKVRTERGGKLYFVDGWYGAAVRVEDGSVELKGIDPGTNSFSVCFWIKTDPPGADPVILGNKNWNSGGNPGLALVLTKGSMFLNASDGKTRSDLSVKLPRDYMTGWMFAAVSVNREANTVSFSVDFAPMKTLSFSPALYGVSYSTGLPARIGQDGTGTYGAKLPAALDEFLLLSGTLTDADIAVLKKYYGA